MEAIKYRYFGKFLVAVIVILGTLIFGSLAYSHFHQNLHPMSDGSIEILVNGEPMYFSISDSIDDIQVSSLEYLFLAKQGLAGELTYDDDSCRIFYIRDLRVNENILRDSLACHVVEDPRVKPTMGKAVLERLCDGKFDGKYISRLF